MYYRRRLLLALLQALGGRVEKMRLHKLLLLYMKQRGEMAYDFVPYRYGAFSFQANAGLVAVHAKLLETSALTVMGLSGFHGELVHR